MLKRLLYKLWKCY